MIIQTSRSQGFTLIELLVVVAIIAILAAISVPNFLEAQTRAKVSSARSGMRSIHLAVMSYAVDNNRIPNQPELLDETAQRMALNSLTTPIGYISTVAPDPFSKLVSAPDPLTRYPYFVNLLQVDAIPANAKEFNKYVVGSVGPNGIQETSEALFDLWGNGWNQIESTGIYDPTNGTVSGGDVVRTSCSERGGH